MTHMYNKKVSTWKPVILILLVVILLGTSRVQAQTQETETLILYEVTENNFPDGDGIYTYGMSEYSIFSIPIETEGDLGSALPDNYEVTSSYTSITNMTVTANILEAFNWTQYFTNSTYNLTFHPEQIMYVQVEETDIDFTRTIRENETFIVEISDYYIEPIRTIEFHLIPSDWVYMYEGRLKLTMTVVWKLTYLISSIQTATIDIDTLLVLPILGALGFGFGLIIYYFRDER